MWQTEHDPTKPSEVYELTRLDTSPSMHLYGGWYHVVGQIVEKSEGTETSHIDSSGAITYTELLIRLGYSYLE